MTHKTLSLMLALLISMVASVASASYSDVNGIFYDFDTSSKTATVTYEGSDYDSYSNEYSGSVVIPSSVIYHETTYNVTSIRSYAFRGCTSLTSVTIPGSVTYIGNGAFMGCTGLKELVLQDGDSEISLGYSSMESGLFYSCPLQTLYLGRNLSYNTSRQYGYSPFYGKEYLTSVTIANGVTSIGANAFSGCSGLASITIPESVTSIGANAFYNTAWYNNQPDGVLYIGKWVCGYKGRMPVNTTIVLKNGTTGIVDFSFEYEINLISIVIPNSVTSISDGAFYGSGLTSITIPNSVTSIGSSAFAGCIDLASITIPNSVTSIGEKAFYNTYLKSLTIGSGVLAIGSNAFWYDRNSGSRPVKVIWLTNTPPTGNEYAAGNINYVANELYTSLSNKTVYPFLSSMFEVDGVKYVPVSPSDKTCDAIDCNYDGTTKNINIAQSVSYKGVPMTVKDIHPYALYEMKGLETVTLGNQGRIGNYAFTNVEIKKKLNIANSVTGIGNYAFNACSGLPYATIDNSGVIGSYAFQNCKELEIAGIGGKVTEIGNNAFDGCSKLQWITIPNSVTVIGANAFSYCTSMTSVKMGTGVKHIEASAFSTCPSLKELEIGSKVESIGQFAFQDCLALPKISIPKTVTSIGNYTFQHCKALKTVIMEDGDETVAQKNTFTDWTSTNKGQHNSTSSYTWTFYVKSGDVLTFNYSVSSESGYDKLTVTLDGISLVEASGERISSVTKTITTSGTATLVAKYTKDSSDSSGSDQAKVYNIKLNGGNQYEGGEDGSHEGDLALGSNGSNPLFSDCPLDSVYIGRNISYQTSSNYGYSPFYRNTSLRSIHISNIETEVSPNEFYGCTNLKNVRLGDGITTIGDWAFSGCSSIDYFLFGNKTESIGKEAFSDCTAMTRLISRAATPPTCGDQALDDINKWECTLEVPVGSKSAYQVAPQWKEFFFMEEGTTGVGRTGNVQSAIENCYDLDGRRLVQPKQGLNIVRMSDGTVKKVLIK